MRRGTLVVSLLAVVTCVAPARAANTYAADELVVAVIDTGIRPTHQEFDYRGRTSTKDQVVAWWDFTDTHGVEQVPAPGQTWDTRTPEPYDDDGHGTGTASLAVGRNAAGEAQKDPAFAAGAKLAVARVCGAAGCGGDIAQAITWAAETVGADVITISIGHIAPALPEALWDVHEAARAARRAGVLVLFANGNGTGNLGVVPSTGAIQAYGDSTEVLSVGGSGTSGLLISNDPEVAAKYSSARIADVKCDVCYRTASGTSFAAPLVAGMAADAMRTAVAYRRDSSPDRIETLLKYAARDTEVPPTYEGYGVLDAQSYVVAREHAAAGTLPSRPSPDVSGTYVESVSGTLRDTWTNRLDSDLGDFVPVAPATGTTGAIGTGSPAGFGEGETYEITLARNEQATVTVSSSFEVRVFDETGAALHGRRLVTRSGIDETVTWRSPARATYTILVVNWLAPYARPYTLTSTSTNPSTPGPAFVAQTMYAYGQTFI